MADLLYEVKEGAAFLTIHREARRNAISQEMMEAFHTYLREAEVNEEVRVVCLTGAGDKAFCSGADLGAAATAEGGQRMGGAERYASLLKEMVRFGKPLVARVNGHCLAGGLGLMLACDIVIARRDVFFWTPEVNVGIFPMMVGALLLRHVGPKKAMEMALTGRRYDALEAEQMGLITRSVPPDQLDAEVEALLKTLAAKSPIGIRLGKEAFREAAAMPFEAAVDYLSQALGRVASTEDAREGMIAFLEKREPRFVGK